MPSSAEDKRGLEGGESVIGGDPEKHHEQGGSCYFRSKPLPSPYTEIWETALRTAIPLTRLKGDFCLVVRAFAMPTVS